MPALHLPFRIIFLSFRSFIPSSSSSDSCDSYLLLQSPIHQPTNLARQNPFSNLFTSYSIAQLYRKILQRSYSVGEETSFFAHGYESSPASGFRDSRRSEYTLSRIFPERFSRAAKKSRVSFVVYLARSKPRTICIGASLAYQGESPPFSAQDGTTCQCPAVA